MQCFTRRLQCKISLRGKAKLSVEASGAMSDAVFPARGAAAQRSRFDFGADSVAEIVLDKLQYFLLDGFQGG